MNQQIDALSYEQPKSSKNLSVQKKRKRRESHTKASDRQRKIDHLSSRQKHELLRQCEDIA